MAKMTFADIADEIGLEETIKMMVEQLNMTEYYARFVIGMERGEIDGDIVEVDEKGEEKEI
jgi:hypothetical protein